jgi:EpsI family protein
MIARGPLTLWIVAAIFAATLALAHAATPVEPESQPNLDAIPFALGAWTGATAPPLDPQVARVLAADRYVHRFYRADRAAIEMDVAYYSQPRVGANMHSPLNCLPGNGWTMGAPVMTNVDAGGQRWQVRSVTVSRGAAHFAMAYWFQSRERVVGDEIAARVHLLGDALRRRPTDAGIVRLIAPVSGSPAFDQAALTDFAAQLIPQLAALLQAELVAS